MLRSKYIHITSPLYGASRGLEVGRRLEVDRELEVDRGLEFCCDVKTAAYTVSKSTIKNQFYIVIAVTLLSTRYV